MQGYCLELIILQGIKAKQWLENGGKYLNRAKMNKDTKNQPPMSPELEAKIRKIEINQLIVA